jgi:hypothetical protein
MHRRGVAHNHPNKTPAQIVEKVLHLRRTYHMGPLRIVWYLERYHDLKTSDATVYRVVSTFMCEISGEGLEFAEA